MLPLYVIQKIINCNYEIDAFRYFVVQKNRNHGGRQLDSFLFIREV